MRTIILIFIVMLIFSCTRYIVERRQFGLEEIVSFPDKARIIKIDTLRNPEGGSVKIVTAKVPKK